MDRGFFLILGAQFLSALADNALFIAALALLKELHAPEWHLSMLLWSFTVSYVVLAPFAGAFADALHKGQAMMICNGIKIAGCLAMLVGLPPIFAYALVGFGAAAYSPAKYGLITEYLPHEKLVAANGWLEGATVAAIIFGTVLGGVLVGDRVTAMLLGWGDLLGRSEWLSPAQFAILVILVVYLAAAWMNLYIPKLHVRLKPLRMKPVALMREFGHCVARLWRDPQGQLSLAVTTLFWGAGATMRLVVLNWAVIWLHFSMEQATRLVAVVAFGTAFGALIAGRWIPLKRAFAVLPAGVAMGVLVCCMLFVNQTPLAALLMFLVGGLAGFFVVPLNAMLQHRGHLLMGAGHSIAVQNFNENLGILVMVGVHALLVRFLSSPVPTDAPAAVVRQFQASGLPPMTLLIAGFGLFVAVTMVWIIRRHRRGIRAGIMHD
ncbi:lysophospholipid transporter LplT [Chitiniphilus shinanonensis]|uniref:Lysophospholipid transporter LplT n=1 Tax=Chitiniphilus shinanonensis TaxID=553088 RepID=A0ABQ6BWR1_9NEIS|nr:lysophospholipid transporter LplT [Chitiniphilus shinanonensis]GLS05615.1 lysophospholipid transporter LplT [Chitiniphilus shinanonensis]